MKNTSSLLVAILIVVFSSNAQTNTMSPPTINEAGKATLDQMHKKDCVFMQNGKMLMMKDGKTLDMPGDVVLSNGDVISTNGSVKKKDGSSRMIKNGDTVDMNGVWERMEKSKK